VEKERKICLAKKKRVSERGRGVDTKDKEGGVKEICGGGKLKPRKLGWDTGMGRKNPKRKATGGKRGSKERRCERPEKRRRR